PLRDQPGPEIDEPIVGAAAVDEVGCPPQIPTLSVNHSLTEQRIEGPDLFRSECEQAAPHRLQLSVLSAERVRPAGLDDRPECRLVHSVSLPWPNGTARLTRRRGEREPCFRLVPPRSGVAPGSAQLTPYLAAGLPPSSLGRAGRGRGSGRGSARP